MSDTAKDGILLEVIDMTGGENSYVLMRVIHGDSCTPPRVGEVFEFEGSKPLKIHEVRHKWRSDKYPKHLIVCYGTEFNERE